MWCCGRPLVSFLKAILVLPHTNTFLPPSLRYFGLSSIYKDFSRQVLVATASETAKHAALNHPHLGEWHPPDRRFGPIFINGSQQWCHHYRRHQGTRQLSRSRYKDGTVIRIGTSLLLCRKRLTYHNCIDVFRFPFLQQHHIRPGCNDNQQRFL